MSTVRVFAGKVATPAMAATEVAPERVAPPAVVSARLTVAVLLVRAPVLSTICTVIEVGIGTPPVLLHGLPPNLSLAAPTNTLATPRLPSESLTCTLSVTLPVAPAVHTPVLGSMEAAPEGLARRDQTNPVPLPPLALKATVPLAGQLVSPPWTVSAGPTWTSRVEVLLSESVTCTLSLTLPVGPARYTPVVGPMLPPEWLVESDQVKPLPLPPLAVKVRVPLGGTTPEADPRWRCLRRPRWRWWQDCPLNP